MSRLLLWHPWGRDRSSRRELDGNIGDESHEDWLLGMVSTGTADPSRILRWAASVPHQWGKLLRDHLRMRGRSPSPREQLPWGAQNRTSVWYLKWAWKWLTEQKRERKLVPHSASLQRLFRWPERIFPSLSCTCIGIDKWPYSVVNAKQNGSLMKPKGGQFTVRSLWKGEERADSCYPELSAVCRKQHVEGPKVLKGF